jgi:hypothetical protein
LAKVIESHREKRKYHADATEPIKSPVLTSPLEIHSFETVTTYIDAIAPTTIRATACSCSESGRVCQAGIKAESMDENRTFAAALAYDSLIQIQFQLTVIAILRRRICFSNDMNTRQSVNQDKADVNCSDNTMASLDRCSTQICNFSRNHHDWRAENGIAAQLHYIG